MTRRSVPLALVVLALAAASAGGQVALTTGVRITSAAKVKPGAYRLADPGAGMVQIAGAGFAVDFRGAHIVGPGSNTGIGIHIADARNVTIRGAHVTGCLWGIVIEHCTGVTLVDCVSSHNGDLPPGTVIDESGRAPENQHGGGILLRDCKACLVRRCTAQHQWDGIDVVRSDGNTIEDGDYSYNGNWGLHLWSASKNVFRRNRALWCTTGEGTLFQALTGWQTYDAQAVGIDHASCDNLIEENDLRFGGDGIFIRANEGGVTPGSPVPPLHSSDRNILRRNDCSFSPNNAIEADFIAGTVIEENNCSNSHYGMWLGYSRGTVVRRNTCLNDTARAIEIENGQNGVIENNLFGFDRDRSDAPLVYLRQNGRDKTPSGPYTIRGNHFFGTTRCVLLRATEADLADNTVLSAGASAAKLVTQETPGQNQRAGSHPPSPPNQRAGEAVPPNQRAGEAVPPNQRADVGAGSPRPTPPFTEVRTRFAPLGEEAGARAPTAPPVIVAGKLVRVAGVEFGDVPAAIELDGIPVWVRRASRTSATFFMPADFWDRPAPSNQRAGEAVPQNQRAGSHPPSPQNQRAGKTVPQNQRAGKTARGTRALHEDGRPQATLRAYTTAGWSRPAQVAIAWPKGSPRVDGISPNPARIGDIITVEGTDLGGELLLDNRAVIADRAGPGRLTFQAPEGILLSTHYNLLVRSSGSSDRFSWPVTFAVDVPAETQPHLLSATFSPTTLRSGEVLTVTFTVRNNLPVPTMLMTTPAPGFTYEEGKAGWEIGVRELPGTLHLRVTSDHPGANEPGSWPWFFGFDRARLAPGATVTVTGRIRVQTPGVHEFRVGLVASGFRFIDDNAFRTRITVLPK